MTKQRVGPAMRRIHDYVSAVPGESATRVLTACGIDTAHANNREALYRAERAEVVIDASVPTATACTGMAGPGRSTRPGRSCSGPARRPTG
jgi:hypothetical protein